MGTIRWTYKKRLRREAAVLVYRTEAGRITTETTAYSRAQEDQARTLLEQREAQTGRVVASRPSVMAEAYGRWVAKRCCEETARCYMAKLRVIVQRLPDRWSAWSPAALAQTLQEYVTARSPRSGELMLQVLRAALTRFHSLGAPVSADWTSGVDLKRKSKGFSGVLTPDQADRVVEAARPPWRLVFALAAWAGLRKAEIERLTWADVRLDTEKLQIRETKTHQDREVDIHPRLKPLLLGQGKPAELVSRASRYNSAFYRMARIIYERAGVEYPKGQPLHILRHTFCSRLLAGGADLVAVRDLMGHSDVRTTNIYAHSYAERRRSAVMGMLG